MKNKSIKKIVLALIVCLIALTFGNSSFAFSGKKLADSNKGKTVLAKSKTKKSAKNGSISKAKGVTVQSFQREVGRQAARSTINKTKQLVNTGVEKAKSTLKKK